MLKIKINELPSYIKLAKASNNNVLVVGDPGVGKSHVINGMADENTKVTAFTGSSTYEETINGIPFRDSGGLDSKLQSYTEPEWLRSMWEFADENPDGTNLLFIDEFNTAEPQVLKTFLSVLTEHKVPTQEKPLPDNTVIVAAMNPCNQNDGEELIRPLASRFMVLEVNSTPDSYLEYFKSKNGAPLDDKKPIGIAVSSTEGTITDSQVKAILDQISSDDWGSFKDGSYHEINPRSMSSFLRAMKCVVNPSRECPNLSLAFFGRSLNWADTIEKQEEKRQERIKKKQEFLTEKELRVMDTEEIQAYYDQISKPNIKGSDKLIECRLNCRTILKERECSSI